MTDDDDDGVPFYDRTGKRISFEQWSNLISDWEYRIVGYDADSIAGWCVSTVWLGHDPDEPMYAGAQRRPHIFGTLVREPAAPGGKEFVYATEEEARAGHAERVRIVRSKNTAGD